MKNVLGSQLAWKLGMALVLFASAVSGLAQTSNRSIRAAPQRQAPALAPGAVGFGAPNPAGLPSPIANPAGLTSQFPAGLPAPAGTTVATPPTTDTTQAPPAPTTGGVGQQQAGTDTAPQTRVMGFGAPAGPLSPGLGSGPYTPLQVAQSFLGADANRDGELTRAEAQRLTIAPYTFEEMDRNHDGIITRFEYEDAMH